MEDQDNYIPPTEPISQPKHVNASIWQTNITSRIAGETESPPTEIPNLSTLMYEHFSFTEGKPSVEIRTKTLPWIEILRKFGLTVQKPDTDVRMIPMAIIQFLEPVGKTVIAAATLIDLKEVHSSTS